MICLIALSEWGCAGSSLLTSEADLAQDSSKPWSRATVTYVHAFCGREMIWNSR